MASVFSASGIENKLPNKQFYVFPWAHYLVVILRQHRAANLTKIEHRPKNSLIIIVYERHRVFASQ